MIAYKINGNILGKHVQHSNCCCENLRINNSISAWVFTLLYLVTGIAFTIFGVLKLGEVDNVNISFRKYEPWTAPENYSTFCRKISENGPSDDGYEEPAISDWVDSYFFNCEDYEYYDDWPDKKELSEDIPKKKDLQKFLDQFILGFIDLEINLWTEEDEDKTFEDCSEWEITLKNK